MNALKYFRRSKMLTARHIFVRAVSAVVMMAALLFLTTGNFWTYGLKKEKQSVVAVPNPVEEEPGSQNPVPNPLEEKSSNGLQNLSEYLHEKQHQLLHPVSLPAFGNRHDIIHYPVHHPELITPPPKKITTFIYC